MKKTLLIFLTIITSTLHGQIQLAGIKSGINWTNLTTTNHIVNPGPFQSNIVAGLTYENRLKKHFLFGIDVLYNQRSFKYENLPHYYYYTKPSYVKDLLQIDFDYIAFQYKVGFHFGKTFCTFVDVGLAPSILLSINVNIRKLQYDGTTILNDNETLSKHVNKLDFSGFFELGTGYTFHNRFCLYASMSYQRGLKRIFVYDPNETVDYKRILHRGFMLCLGLKVVLNTE